MYANQCHNTCMEVRGQLAEIIFLFPPCGLWGLNSGHQGWQQVHLPNRIVPKSFPV